MNWAVKELVAADFGDVRLSDRLIDLVKQFSDHPEASTPEACGSAAAAKAAYRFWDHPRVTAEAILQAHAEETARRSEQYDTVLVVQDTTEINLTSHGKTAGLGYLGSSDGRGLMLHSLPAVSPDGTPLGVLHQQTWFRPLEELGKRRQRNSIIQIDVRETILEELGKRRQRNSKPIEEKESFRWLSGLQAAQTALPDHPHVVVVADRESDLYDLFAMPREDRVDLLVRVRERRRGVQHSAKYLENAVKSSPPQGKIVVELPRSDGRPRRQAELTRRWIRWSLCRPANHLGLPPERPVELTFLMAVEENPPEGVDPIDWLLAMTMPIESLADAVRFLHWYLFRWRIEQFYYVLKSGCRIERRQLGTAERMKRAIAAFSIVAWRLLWLTYEARREPEASCTRVLDPDECQVLCRAIHPGRAQPCQPPTLRQAVRWIAGLGGFLGRKHDGDPGGNHPLAWLATTKRPRDRVPPCSTARTPPATC